MTASILGYKYRVEVEFWTRSHDGDDWITGSHWFNFNSLNDAVEKAKNPYTNTKDLIESKVVDYTSRDVIWKKDWHKNEVVDYTTIPDFDYHNREYD
jgi:hypothetical protein